ncbi:MAG: methyltransferase family protein [Steroidobacteraceae bacterium]
MTTVSPLIDGLWLAFVVIWLVAAQFNKRASAHAPWKTWVARLAILALLIGVRLHSGDGRLAVAAGPVRQYSGAVLVAFGLGFAVWARLHLGRNWGMPMSLRAGHELVTSGPYAYVRHPIYTGILLALLGSTIALDPVWGWALALLFAYFLYSARTEERMMDEQFPEAYAAYKARTRMLIPFVF